MREFLLVCGLAVLTAAFFSYSHPLLRRLGLLSLTATLVAAGYFATGSFWAAAACGAGWMALPWLEILLRVRKMRLPLRKQLRQSVAPAREVFPELPQLSGEIEEHGFERAEDLGWETGSYRQFLRLFSCPERREEAAITFVEQNGMGFHFVSVTSRAADGAVFTTWNCPVSPSLKVPPGMHVNRASPEAGFTQLLARHGEFVRQRAGEGFVALAPSGVREAVEGDMESQMRHNVAAGILSPAGEGCGRYSWRGMLYLWFQFLRDIFRLA